MVIFHSYVKLINYQRVLGLSSKIWVDRVDLLSLKNMPIQFSGRAGNMCFGTTHDGSMYGIYGNMNPINIPPMLVYIPYMDPMGY